MHPASRFLCTLALGAVAAVAASATEIKLPPETARFAESPLPGYTLAASMCATCHSADYVRMQPRSLTATYWKGAVVKMQKTFGAPIPNEAIDPIAEYLAKTYGTTSAPAPAATKAAHPAAPAAPTSK